jgi:serine/threonine protein kinase
MSDIPSDDEPSEPPDPSTWSSDDTGSHRVDRELQRELVRAALFDGRSAPRIGRFIVAERLGAGASSVVYAAWDDLLARRVAVKIFVADMVATQDQFQREAHALGQLSHRNVVAVYDVGEWKGHAFIAMELIAGETLARWQASRKRSTEELLDAYLQAGRGLAAAHQAGLVHRDFKPANVMVAGDGRVVVTDFGLAGNVAPDARDTEIRGPAGSGVSTRRVLGTPAYVAPEQRSGATPHPSADLYSFSVALCEALIGWHPMRDTEPAWRRALARRVPRRISEAIATGLAPQPAERGDTMASLLMALTPARRRRRRGVALVLAGLVAVVAVVGFKLGCDGARAQGPRAPAAVPHAVAPRLLRPPRGPPPRRRAPPAGLRLDRRRLRSPAPATARGFSFPDAAARCAVHRLRTR